MNKAYKNRPIQRPMLHRNGSRNELHSAAESLRISSGEVCGVLNCEDWRCRLTGCLFAHQFGYPFIGLRPASL
jgi:hypothetical protein